MDGFSEEVLAQGFSYSCSQTLAGPGSFQRLPDTRLSRRTVCVERRICMGVHLVSVAAVTKYHTKPHKFIISQFYRLESLYGSFWAKTKVLAGLLLPGGSSGEFISLPFLIPRGYLHPWLMVPSSTFRACNRVQPRGGGPNRDL